MTRPIVMEMRAETVATQAAQLCTLFSTLDKDGMRELQRQLNRQWACGTEERAMHNAISDVVDRMVG